VRNAVLLIHHNAIVRSLFRSVLHYNGYQVFTAENDKSGLEQANQSPPDLIILELNLPDVGGLEVISRLKGNVATHNIPVIVCTDRTDSGVRSEALHRGAASILTTPVTPAELLKVVRAYIYTTPPQQVAVSDARPC
jgi:two-component system chemotaxis response regulator CheY